MQHDPLASSPSDPGREAWAAALLLRRPELLNRFQVALERLRSLPGAARRRIKRRAAVSLAGAALLLALSSGPLLTSRVHAANITVGGACSLVDAIRSANADTSYGTCAAGSGPDVITLTGDVTLTAVYDYSYYSDTGLPVVFGDLTIDGAGFTISRDGAAPDFRILAAGSGSDLTLQDVTISGGRTAEDGGGVYSHQGDLTLLNVTLSGNYSYDDGGGVEIDDGDLSVRNSIVTENTTGPDGHGGGVSVDDGATARIYFSSLSDNDAGYLDGHGGGLVNYDGTTVINNSTISGNSAGHLGGGIASNSGYLYVHNSTISGNSAEDGGGIFSQLGMARFAHATITGNSSTFYAGGVRLGDVADARIAYSIISGNVSSIGPGDEVYIYGGTVMSTYNVLGHNGVAGANVFFNFTPDASDVTATNDGTDPTALAGILSPILAFNGGLTRNHALVDGSPAIDLVPAGLSIDQRGFLRPVGSGYDAGAYEFGATALLGDIYVTAFRAGVTDDALAFGPHDILEWNGTAWSKWFDGTATGLTPNGKNKHNLAGFWFPDAAGEDVVLAFVQNSRFVPGITGKVDGMDLVWWDGSAFSLFFDGQDVGLTNKTNEKIDALHVLDGGLSPVGGSCVNYLLVSTQGAGQVPGPGGPIKFGGEDVLGFCQTNVGAATAGFWHKLIDGSDEGVPKNAINGLSFSPDGQTMYLTTHNNFVVDSAAGGHSMIYLYRFATGEFSGPHWVAADNGLHEKVNGLQLDEPIIIP